MTKIPIRQEIKFDFNNMFSTSVGNEHGVTETDLAQMQIEAKNAYQHLKKIISNPGERIKLSLEWTRLPFQDQVYLKEIKKLGNQIAKKYDNVIFLGIGGSYLGLKAAQDAFCPPYYNEFPSLRKARARIYFEGNNLDPDTLSALLKSLNPKKTFVVVISKSGETTETKAAFTIVENWLKVKIGKNYGRQVFAITDPEAGTLRKKVNAAQQIDKLSFRSFSLLKGVGGRFSEFNMGLLHLAIIGVDIEEVFSGAKGMFRKCENEDLFRNPAAMYAILHTILYRRKNKSIAILMPFSETLKSSADWYIQLLAESLGKKYARKTMVNSDGSENWEQDKEKIVNVGRTPVSSRGTNDLHSIQQNNIEGENNKVVTFIKVEKFRSQLKVPGKGDILSGKQLTDLIKLAQEATEWALVQAQKPSCTIVMPEVSGYHWGELLFFFEMATAFEGELLNVNAFDQPGVEGYKNYMYYKLGKTNIPEEISHKIKNNPLTKDPKYIL